MADWMDLCSYVTGAKTLALPSQRSHPQIYCRLNILSRSSSETKPQPLSCLLLHLNCCQRTSAGQVTITINVQEMGVVCLSRVSERAAAAGGQVFKDFHLGRWGGRLPTSDQPHLFLPRRERAACRSVLGHHTSRQPQWGRVPGERRVIKRLSLASLNFVAPRWRKVFTELIALVEG